MCCGWLTQHTGLTLKSDHQLPKSWTLSVLNSLWPWHRHVFFTSENRLAQLPHQSYQPISDNLDFFKCANFTLFVVDRFASREFCPKTCMKSSIDNWDYNGHHQGIYIQRAIYIHLKECLYNNGGKITNIWRAKITPPPTIYHQGGMHPATCLLSCRIWVCCTLSLPQI